jgi:ADP-ribose pyrophosphatase
MPEDKKPEAKITDIRRVFNGFFKVDEYDVEMDKHEGGTRKVTRLVFERGHAVAILGYDPKRDEVLLVNEMRVGLLAAGDYPFSDALPAGMIDKGESEIDAARREMLEETGLVLNNPSIIHPGAYVSAGGTSERITLVFGLVDMSKAGGVHGHAAEGEDIKSVIVKSDDFIKHAESGALKDMKSLVAAFWLANNKTRLQSLYAAGDGIANDNGKTPPVKKQPPKP